MAITVTNKSLNKDAKIAKKFLVLIKRKLQRGQIPRSRKFCQLLALLDASKFEDRIPKSFMLMHTARFSMLQT